jgi:glycosyltransferase involved in cell wall biosynthesis
VQEHDDARLVIAGGLSTSQSDDVPALVRQFGISDKAILVGQLKLQEVVDLMAAADVLVLPKIDHLANRAGVATKLAEYLAAGRPVVASNIGDVSLYLHHREHALLCEPGNVRELAESISTLLSDPSLADRLAQRGRMVAAEAFDVRSNVKRMLAAFTQVS